MLVHVGLLQVRSTKCDEDAESNTATQVPTALRTTDQPCTAGCMLLHGRGAAVTTAQVAAVTRLIEPRRPSLGAAVTHVGPLLPCLRGRWLPNPASC